MAWEPEIEISCGLPPGPEFADHAVLAEQLGYSRIWIFDSAPLWEDPVAHLALAATRTSRIGLGTAVLIPTQRSVMAMASALATIHRLAGGRFRPCFGTGYTAQMTTGHKPMRLDDFFDYVAALRLLLAGDTVVIDGAAARMIHAPELTEARPIAIPLWVSVLGPVGNRRAREVADGTIGPLHPQLPTATMISGTVLDPGESPVSPRVLAAIAPWRVVGWHTAYAVGGPAAVDAKPGGVEWRKALEALAPARERHLLTFERHVSGLTARDEILRDHIDTKAGVADPEGMRGEVHRLSEAGFCEVIYTPSGPDVPRELRAFAAATTAAR
ncbi:MAG TPA: LLM class flavin-dependent oxidoreductase [Acidimicrobiales bacterium]|nr:LLM class flavin-dependent oxidoreductase [Acidimicrobiales bacterium]